MAKTKYQQAGTDYAREYLDKLLNMESFIDSHLNQRIDYLVRLRMGEINANNNKVKPKNEKEP